MICGQEDKALEMQYQEELQALHDGALSQPSGLLCDQVYAVIGQLKRKKSASKVKAETQGQPRV